MAEGLTLAGRYRLVTKLGQGGMGSVWRAQHLTLGIPVAIKLIDPAIAQSEEALARFRREAQAAAELRSAHVVQILDYGVDNNTPYIAMELLEGESLAARLERVGQLPPVETANILTQVGRALTRAHQQNIIHRDLKPENIFLISEGDDELAKVLDFGIAKKLGLQSTSSGVNTHTGAMLGTPYYMSPEQAKGHATVDHRADIWSLGIIAYECMTGKRPFDGETLASLLISICTEPLPIPSTVAAVPVGFDAWFARASSRDLSLRFQTASEAIVQLRDICGLSSRKSLEITAAPGATGERNAKVLELVQTGDPSTVTIGGTKKKSLRGVTMVAAGVVLLTITGLLAARLFSKPATVTTNASASPSLSQGIAAATSNHPPAIASAITMPEVKAAQTSATPSNVPSTLSSEAVAKASGNAAKAHPAGGAKTNSQSGSARAVETKVNSVKSSANAANAASKSTPQAVR